MKYLFPLLHLILLTLAAALVVAFVYQRVGMEGSPPSQEAAGAPPALEAARQKASSNSFKQQYAVIGARNLFQVLTEESTTGGSSFKNQAGKPETIKLTPLQLTLRGTVTGLAQVYAVIEDKKAKKQEFYTTGDAVQGALLTAVYKDHVILEYNGEKQRLEMSTEGDAATGRTLLRPLPRKKALLETEAPETETPETDPSEAPEPPAKKIPKTEAPEFNGQEEPIIDEGNDE